MLLSSHNGEPFNVGNDDIEISMEYLANKMVEIFNYKPGIQHSMGLNDAYAKGDPKRRCPDLTKIRTMIGYTPKIDLKTGLIRFMEWVKETRTSEDALNFMKLKNQ